LAFETRNYVSGTEWLLVVMVILVPLALAVIVTKWTLDQALKRSRKNRESASRGERTPTPLATSTPDEHLSSTE
jgi:hypothetical protein